MASEGKTWSENIGPTVNTDATKMAGKDRGARARERERDRRRDEEEDWTRGVGADEKVAT